MYEIFNANFEIYKLDITDKIIRNSFYTSAGWNDKIIVQKKTTLQLYFKTLIEKINSGYLIM